MYIRKRYIPGIDGVQLEDKVLQSVIVSAQVSNTQPPSPDEDPPPKPEPDPGPLPTDEPPIIIPPLPPSGPVGPG
jgi:hypothetical protein